MDENKININPGTIEKIKNYSGPIHIVLIGTKPDIIKQAPLIFELKKRGENILIIHSGQHYDWNLSKGLEEEFGINPDINLNVKGTTLYEQQAQIISRFGEVISDIKKINKKIIPYTYSDTTSAVAGGVASFANSIAVAHVEAGLRTLSPPKEVLTSLLYNRDVVDYFNELKHPENWKKGSYEPYPEQFDTRASAPSAGIHLAPTELNKKQLMDEGYDEKRIFVVGNPVVDSIKFAKDRINSSTIFEKYPKLIEGNFIRFCIHRRENVSSKHRFKSIILAMEKLVKEGKNILFISLNGTEKALDSFGLKERINELDKEYDNFIYSPVWPKYTDVIAAMEKCSVIATDSGSIQEEANVMGIPGVILRFNTERPETIFSGSNILAPPIREDIVYKIVKEIHENKELHNVMSKSGNLYGKDVGKKIVDAVNGVISEGPLFQLLEHEILGFSKFDFWEKGEIEW
ncbi:hypothetical protein CMI46_01285 [Candidatus Pacearchaeota archaeon]|nr:hypothetical protein [Candidatus Pacearchaeota archaeon]|tara:strand:+ start:18599 stop:19978 length:1380 start_codon:yes stop_codon:yes gene_type:complete